MLKLFSAPYVYNDHKWGCALCHEKDAFFRVPNSPFNLPEVTVKNFANMELSAIDDLLHCSFPIFCY